MVLGADGINSSIRKQIISSRGGNNDPRHYHGSTHYRGVAEDFGLPNTCRSWELGVKVVVYSIGKPCNVRRALYKG